MASAPPTRQELIASYKQTLRQFIDRRPSGIRQKIAEVTGTHKSFISQITNPADGTPLPARHIDAIFEVCHLSQEERSTFLEQYRSAHAEHARVSHRARRHMRTLHIQIPVLDDSRKQEALESIIRDTVRRLCSLID